MRKRNWAERLAGFFAAKEATRKAFGHAIPWRKVGVGARTQRQADDRAAGEARRLLEQRAACARFTSRSRTRPAPRRPS